MMAMVVTKYGSHPIEGESYEEITQRFTKACETDAMTFEFRAQTLAGQMSVMIPTETLIRIESL